MNSQILESNGVRAIVLDDLDEIVTAKNYRCWNSIYYDIYKSGINV